MNWRRKAGNIMDATLDLECGFEKEIFIDVPEIEKESPDGRNQN